MEWRLFRGDVAREDVIAAMSRDLGEDVNEDDERAVKGAVDVNEMSGAIEILRRSRGSVQHDVFDWRDHHQRYSDGSYTLAITSLERWNRTNPAPVPFAVVVSLEEESRTVPIHNVVRAEVPTPTVVRV
jgi:hypothetical protein